MLTSQHLGIFILSVIIVVAGYALVAVSAHRKSYKTKTLKAAQQFLDEQQITVTRLSPFAQFCRAAVRSVGVNAESVKQEQYIELGRAGLLSEASLSYFLFFRSFIQPVFLIAALMIVLPMLINDQTPQGMGLLGYIVIVAGLAYVGLNGATMVMRNRTKKRDRSLYLSFPDAVDLLMVCIEAGQSLDSALARICQELRSYHPVITEELDRTRLELGLTTDRIKALNNLAERTNTLGFRSLVAALVQSERYGTNLANTLRVLSDEFRTSRLLNAENKAARVPALMTLPLILFIFFPFIGMIMAPPMITLFQQNVFGR